MKKKYCKPCVTVVSLEMAHGILVGSDENIEIEITEEEARGSEALSLRYDDLWPSKEMWK